MQTPTNKTTRPRPAAQAENPKIFPQHTLPLIAVLISGYVMFRKLPTPFFHFSVDTLAGPV
jgi:hypothetical protein